MLVVQSFPLSLAILRRFLIVMPLWVLLYVVLTVAAIWGGIALASVSLIGLVGLLLLPLLLFAVSAIVSVHPYMIGIGIGLDVLGVPNTAAPERLMKPAIGYGLAEAVLGFVISAMVLTVSYLMIRGGVSPAALSQARHMTDPMASLASEAVRGSLTLVTGLAALATMAVRAALLPALASATAGADVRGGKRNFFTGLGQDFLPMMLLLLIVTALSALVLPVIGSTLRSVGLTSLLTEQLSATIRFVANGREIQISLAQALIVIGAILISAWLFSLQCAAAALSHATRAEAAPHPRPRKSEPQTPAATPDRLASTDIAALRHARMQKNLPG